MPDRMSDSEIQEYIALANEDLSAAQDNLRLGHLLTEHAPVEEADDAPE